MGKKKRLNSVKKAPEKVNVMLLVGAIIFSSILLSFAYDYGFTGMSVLTTQTTVSSCADLNSPNTIYDLQNDINSSGTCFNITAENVTLDCHGFAINYGKHYSGKAIKILADNAQIKNCIISQQPRQDYSNMGGDHHTCTLKSNGSVQCWGQNTYGESSGYTGTDAIAVSAGWAHTCFLKSSGSVECKGWNFYGNANNYTGTDAIAVSAGYDHTCALKSSGSIGCWGRNDKGQSESYVGTDAIAVSAGWQHTCALKSNGSVQCWGQNADVLSNYTGGDAIGISTGILHSCALKSNGSVQCLGNNNYGQSVGYTGTDAVELSLGYYHTCALKSNGSVQCWGNYSGSWNASNNYTGTDAIAVSAGNYNTCVLKSNGSVQCWGRDDFGQSANYPGSDAVFDGSKDIEFLNSNRGSVVNMTFSSMGYAPISMSFTFGGNVSIDSTPSPPTNESISLGKFIEIKNNSAGAWVYLNVSYTNETNEGGLRMYEWDGSSWSLVPGINGVDTVNNYVYANISSFSTFAPMVVSTQLSDCTDQTAGNTIYTLQNNVSSSGTCFTISSDNVTLDCNGFTINYGRHYSGKAIEVLADNAQIKNCIVSQQPRQIYSNNAGGVHTCALKSNGSIECWGSVGGWSQDYTGTDVIAVSLGAAHNCALKSNGSIECLGTNNFGSTEDYTGTDAVAVSAGYYHNCALKSNGSIECWGRNDYGESNNYDGTDAVAVSAGQYHTCALKSNGSIECWGRNDYGQSNNYTGTDVIAVSLGRGDNTCALKSDGSIQCWGRNDYGQSNNYTGTDVIAVSSGLYNTCALKSDGSIQCWGRNDWGQSNNYTGNDAIAVSLGGAHTCALKSNGSIECWGYNGLNDGRADNYDGTDAVFDNSKDVEFTDSHGNSVVNMTFSSISYEPISVSFTFGGNVSIDSTIAPPTDGYVSLDKFIEIKNNSAGAWVYLNVSYANETNENGLRMYEWDGSSWTLVPGINGVDTVNNYVYANISSFSIFAPMVDPNQIFDCADLTTENFIYNLQGNVNSPETCFTISANNVTLDCQGFNITYSESTPGIGVLIESANSTTVKNCNIVQVGNSTEMAGIFLQSSNLGMITNNSITTSGPEKFSQGIRLNADSDNNIISNNYITTNGSEGIGIRLYANCSGNYVYNNTVITEGNYSQGIWFQLNSNNNTVLNNLINTSGVGSSGIELATGSSNNNLTNNTVTTTNSLAHGIFLDSSSDNNVYNNAVITSGINGVGIFATNGFGLVIARNTLNLSNSTGITFDNLSDSTIVNNTITSLLGICGVLIEGGSNGDRLVSNVINSPLDLCLSESNSIWLADQPIENYTFTNSKFIVEDTNNGVLLYLHGVGITQAGENLSNDIQISSNKIFVNSTAKPGFNVSADLIFYNIGFTNSQPLVDFYDNDSYEVCNPPQCNELDQDQVGTFRFNVSGFTTYSSEETPVVAPPGGGGGGGGSSSCSKPWICTDWSPETGIAGQNQTRDCDCACSNENNCEGDSSTSRLDSTPVCKEDWECSDWSVCFESKIQLRLCEDENECGTEELKPVEFQSCVVPAPELEEESIGVIAREYAAVKEYTAVIARDYTGVAVSAILASLILIGGSLLQVRRSKGKKVSRQLGEVLKKGKESLSKGDKVGAMKDYKILKVYLNQYRNKIPKKDLDKLHKESLELYNKLSKK